MLGASNLLNFMIILNLFIVRIWRLSALKRNEHRIRALPTKFSDCIGEFDAGSFYMSCSLCVDGFVLDSEEHPLRDIF